MKIVVDVGVFEGDDMLEEDTEAVKAYVEQCFQLDCEYELPDGRAVMFVGTEVTVTPS